MSSRSRGGLGDFIAHEASRAIQDVRLKLLEGAWYGLTVPTEHLIGPYQERNGDMARAFDALWGRTPEGAEQPEHELAPDLDPDEPDIER